MSTRLSRLETGNHAFEEDAAAQPVEPDTGLVRATEESLREGHAQRRPGVDGLGPGAKPADRQQAAFAGLLDRARAS